ncbi:MAG: thermonuclease family protein [Nitrospinae bacterium]|nr:thermonuclease family protein [Nitrospinota bacterium]
MKSGTIPGMNGITALTLSAWFVLLASPAWSDPAITGPVAAKVIKVYDGDTFTVEAYPWPGITAKASIRVNGVDTPEIRGKCESEKRKAIEARDFVRGLVLGETVFLQNVKYGKFAGRVIADVKLNSGDNLAAKIISQGLGREYHGGAGEGWCPVN